PWRVVARQGFSLDNRRRWLRHLRRMPISGGRLDGLCEASCRGDFMGSFSIWHWLIVIAVGALLFGGRGKITNVMGDFAKGIKAFKAGLKDDDKDEDKDAGTTAQNVPPKVTASPTSEAQRTK